MRHLRRSEKMASCLFKINRSNLIASISRNILVKSRSISSKFEDASVRQGDNQILNKPQNLTSTKLPPKNLKMKLKNIRKRHNENGESESIVGVYVGGKLSLELIKKYFSENSSQFVVRPILCEVEEHQTIALTKMIDHKHHSDVFIMEEMGCCVFWNTSAEDIKVITSIMHTCLEGPATHTGDTEELAFSLSDSHNTYFQKGKVFIKRFNNWDEIAPDKYVISYAISNSLKLSQMEEQVENFNNFARGLRQPKMLSFLNYGSAYRDAIKQAYHIQDLRLNINLDSDLLSDPDFLWDFDEYELLYKNASKYFDITKRTESLNSRLSYLETLLQLHVNNIHVKWGVAMEFVIIILIAIEVLALLI